MNRGKFNLEIESCRFQQSRSFCASTKKPAINMSLINVNGPVDSPVKMPKRLEGVLDLHQKFAYDPFARAQNVEANRQSHLAMIR